MDPVTDNNLTPVQIREVKINPRCQIPVFQQQTRDKREYVNIAAEDKQINNCSKLQICAE